LNAVVYPQLVVDIRKVKVDGSFGNKQLVGGLFTAATLGDKIQHFYLPLGEPNGSMCRFRSDNRGHRDRSALNIRYRPYSFSPPEFGAATWRGNPTNPTKIVRDFTGVRRPILVFA
jgi:hypothetical protein